MASGFFRSHTMLEERLDFYIKAALLAIFCPLGFSLKDIDTPVSERSKRRFILEMEKAGFVSRMGMRNVGKWVRDRKLVKIATGCIIDNPIMIPGLCEIALGSHPPDTTKVQLLKKMLVDLQQGSMKRLEEPTLTTEDIE